MIPQPYPSISLDKDHFNQLDQKPPFKKKLVSRYLKFQYSSQKFFLCESISEELFECMSKFVQLNTDILLKIKQENLSHHRNHLFHLVEDCVILMEIKKNCHKLNLTQMSNNLYALIRRKYSSIERRLYRLVLKFKNNQKYLMQILKQKLHSLIKNSPQQLMKNTNQQNYHLQHKIPKKISFFNCSTQVTKTIPVDKMSIEQLDQFYNEVYSQAFQFASYQTQFKKQCLLKEKSIKEKQLLGYEAQQVNRKLKKNSLKSKMYKNRANRITLFIQQVIDQKVISLMVAFIAKIKKIVEQNIFLLPGKLGLYEDCLIMLEVKKNHNKLKFCDVVQLISKVIHKPQTFVMRRFYMLSKFSQQSLLFHLLNEKQFQKVQETIQSNRIKKQKLDHQGMIADQQINDQRFQFSFGQMQQSDFQSQKPIRSSYQQNFSFKEASCQDEYSQQIIINKKNQSNLFLSSQQKTIQNKADVDQRHNNTKNDESQVSENTTASFVNQAVSLQKSCGDIDISFHQKQKQQQKSNVKINVNNTHSYNNQQRKDFNNQISNGGKKRFRKLSKKIDYFLQNTLSEEVIKLVKKILIDKKEEFDLHEKILNQKKSYKYYSLYEDCLILVTVKQNYQQVRFTQLLKDISKQLKRTTRALELRYYNLSKLSQQQLLYHLRHQIQIDSSYLSKRTNCPILPSATEQTQRLKMESPPIFSENVLQCQQNKFPLVQSKNQPIQGQKKISNQQIHQAESIYEQTASQKVNCLTQIKVQHINDFEQAQKLNIFQEIKNQIKISKDPAVSNKKQSLKISNVNKKEFQQIKDSSNSLKFINSQQTVEKQKRFCQKLFQDYQNHFLKDYYDEKETEIYSFGDVKHQNLQQTKKQIKFDKIMQKQSQYPLKNQLSSGQWSSQFELLAQTKLKPCSKQMMIKFEINLNNQVQETLSCQQKCGKSDNDLQKVIKFYVVKKESFQPKLKSEKAVNAERINQTFHIAKNQVQTLK